jgi:hypothetical protein
MHLKEEQFVDLAEGALAESAVPHLLTCDACRRQLAEMRGVMASVAEDEVPEPSPLYWDHLSANVAASVAANGAPRGAWRDWLGWPRVMAPMTAVAAAALFFAVQTNRVESPTAPDSPSFARASASPDSELSGPARVELLNDSLGGDDDPSLRLVAGLTASLDADGVGEAGLTSDGSADHAITHLDSIELRELRRLIREEMAVPGA